MLALRSSALLLFLPIFIGCASIKQSDTARTGVEQLLVSSAIDRSLDRVDFRAIAGASVYVEQKYLECVDKNYVVVALHQRLLKAGCTLVDKPEDANVCVEVGSGGVGTDRQEMFFGIPELSVPLPLPMTIPKLAFYNRTRSNGTAKLAIVAYDVKSRQAVINSGAMLARSDHKAWSLLGTGQIVSGNVPDELEKATGESESLLKPTNPIHALPVAGRPATVR